MQRARPGNATVVDIPALLVVVALAFMAFGSHRVAAKRAKSTSQPAVGLFVPAGHVEERIFFEPNQHELRPEARRWLDALALRLKHPTAPMRIEVRGYASPEENYPQRLAQRRAQRALDYLVKKGVDRARLHASCPVDRDLRVVTCRDQRVDLVAIAKRLKKTVKACIVKPPLTAKERAKRILIRISGCHVVTEPVFFDDRSATLRDRERKRLNGFAEALLSMPEIRSVMLRGWRDPSEDRPAGLARRRAQAVHDYLVAQGVPRRRLQLSVQTKVKSGRTAFQIRLNRQVRVRVTRFDEQPGPD